MPQMMPINWMMSFFFFLLIFILFNIMNYFIYFMMPNKFKINKKKNFFLWKW